MNKLLDVIDLSVGYKNSISNFIIENFNFYIDYSEIFRPALIHLDQRAGVQSAGHIGVDHLDGRQTGHLGALHAQGAGEADGIPQDVGLLLQVGIGVERGVGDEEDAVEALDLVEVAVGDDLAAAQADLLIQHSAQKVIRVQLSLHVDVGTLRGNLGHGDEPALGHMLHIGHLNILTAAAARCERLVVGVADRKSVV